MGSKLTDLTRISSVDTGDLLYVVRTVGDTGVSAAVSKKNLLDDAYQPLDADLTSWAAVTRASGFDTLVATPSSANLRSLLTDETGTGAAVFGTNPTVSITATGSTTGRTLQERFAEAFNVKDYGAVGDGSTDDFTAVQAAITAAIAASGGRGGAVFFPPGNYRVTDKLVADLTTSTTNFEDCLNLFGTGSPFTRITYAGGAAEALLEITGDTTYVANHLRIEGITFYGDLTASGIGLDITTSAFPQMVDVNFWNFALGMRCDNVEQALFTRCNWRWNTKGFEFLPSAGTTDPNSLTFIECQVGNNTDHGFSIEHANGVVWLGGSIQYNGGTGDAGDYGCKFIDPGTGYGNISFFGTIFEGNGGDADLWVDATSDASMTTVIGCSFARANDTNYATNHIRMSGSAAVQRLVLRGNTHRHFNAYVVNAARPYINLSNSNCDVHDDGSNYYQSTTEDPAWNLSAIGYGMNYNGQLWRVGTDQVLQIGPAFTVAGGVMIQGLTDNFGSLVPVEVRTTALRLTAASGTDASGHLKSFHATGGIGYSTGAGLGVTQLSSRTTGVTINAVCGGITLVSAAGSATFASFTVTNSAVAATDTIIINQKSGTDLYEIHITAVAAGSFRVTFRTTGGTTTEQPVFNYSVIKAVAA